MELYHEGCKMPCRGVFSSCSGIWRAFRGVWRAVCACVACLYALIDIYNNIIYARACVCVARVRAGVCAGACARTHPYARARGGGGVLPPHSFVKKFFEKLFGRGLTMADLCGIMKALDVEVVFHTSFLCKGTARCVTRVARIKRSWVRALYFFTPKHLTMGGKSDIIEMHNKWCVLAYRHLILESSLGTALLFLFCS